MTAYFNEIDAGACAWLRELVKDGTVDERSICDVKPDDVAGFRECHFFAGIGGWAYALRLAGWPAGLPVWTASLPCQPFSVAGARKGTDDERHLWPVFRELVAECRPSTIFGEQVASGDGREWLAGVRTDLEALGYAVGAADLCAAGVGAPHIRQRLYWVAISECDAAQSRGTSERPGSCTGSDREGQSVEPRRSGDACGMADSCCKRGWEECGSAPCDESADGRRTYGSHEFAGGFQTDGMGNAEYDDRRPDEQGRGSQGGAADWRDGSVSGMGNADGARSQGRDQAGCARELPSRPSGLEHWADFDIIPCRDPRREVVFRRIPSTKSGILPLVDGLPRGMGSRRDQGAPINANATAEARVMRLRGYGNAIVPQLAARFVRAVMEIKG